MRTSENMIGSKPSKRTWIAILNTVAILTVIGLVPAVIFIIGPIAVSTAVVAAVFLMARRYGVIASD